MMSRATHGEVLSQSQLRENVLAKRTLLLRSALVEKIVKCAKGMSLANKLVVERQKGAAVG